MLCGSLWNRSNPRLTLPTKRGRGEPILFISPRRIVLGMHDTGVSITVPGEPVPWTGKAVNRKTGNRFIPARQAEATGRILAAIERVTDESFPADTPLVLVCEFYVRRPKAHYGTGSNAQMVKPRFLNARPMGR